jgi:hypothetical protein
MILGTVLAAASIGRKKTVGHDGERFGWRD